MGDEEPPQQEEEDEKLLSQWPAQKLGVHDGALAELH